MKTMLSPNRHSGRIKAIRLVVLHTMEVGETSNVAEAVGSAFMNPARRASAHVCTDNDSDVRCVPDSETAWAAPGANADGLQHELAGRAGQTSSQWDDAYSSALLKRAAKVNAAWAVKYDIPIRHLTVAQVRDGKSKGFCSHDDVSKAFGLSTHWDPGPNFPWSRYLDLVRQYADQGAKPRRARTVLIPAVTKRELQRQLGVEDDGVLGHDSWSAVQRKINELNEKGGFLRTGLLKVDGIYGNRTQQALISALNYAHRLGVVKYAKGYLNPSYDRFGYRRLGALRQTLHAGFWALTVRRDLGAVLMAVLIGAVAGAVLLTLLVGAFALLCADTLAILIGA